MMIEVRPWGFGDWDRRKISKKGEEREVPLGAGESLKALWLGPCLCQCGLLRPSGCWLQPSEGPSADKGPHRPGIFGCSSPGPGLLLGKGGHFLLSWSSSLPGSSGHQLSPDLASLWLSLVQANSFALRQVTFGASPTGVLSIWCHRWGSIVCGQCHENARHQVPPRLIPLPSEPDLRMSQGLEIGWQRQ